MHRIKCNPHTRLKRYIVYLIAVAVSAIITWQVYEYSKGKYVRDCFTENNCRHTSVLAFEAGYENTCLR